MRPLSTLLALAWLVPTAALAQPFAPAPVLAAGNTVLTVTGEGRSTRAPDTAVFTAGVTTQAATAVEALSENTKAMSGAIAQLRRAGIAEKDIQTSNLSVEPLYSDPNRDAAMAARYRSQPYVPAEPAIAPRIIGYRVSNTVAVKQRDLKHLGRVIDTLVSAGANQVYGPSFTLEEPDEAINEARQQAISKAKSRAELYARAVGLRVLRILSITEGGGYDGSPPIVFATSASMRSSAPPPPPAPIQPGELQLNANVTLILELGTL